jgi:hypothetical protein
VIAVCTHFRAVPSPLKGSTACACMRKCIILSVPETNHNYNGDGKMKVIDSAKESKVDTAVNRCVHFSRTYALGCPPTDSRKATQSVFHDAKGAGMHSC